MLLVALSAADQSPAGPQVLPAGFLGVGQHAAHLLPPVYTDWLTITKGHQLQQLLLRSGVIRRTASVAVCLFVCPGVLPCSHVDVSTL